MAKNNYVNNQKLLEAFEEWQKEIRSAKKSSLPEPPVPNYIGECILKIAEHLSYKPNFIGYSYREDLVGDAIENCLQYIKNFNPKISKNPFGYITQICMYAFFRRIYREKKQLVIKYSCIQNSSEFMEYVNQEHDDKSYENTYLTFLRRNMTDIISEFEEKKQAKKDKKKKDKENLEKFFVEDKAQILP